MTEMEKRAYADAYRQKFRLEVLAHSYCDFLRCDRRTTYGKLVLRFYNAIEIDHQQDKRNKHLERRFSQRETPFTPLFERPLIKDWIANKKDCTGIYSDHLEFHQRNHWAKNQFDVRFLEILQKYYKGKNQ